MTFKHNDPKSQMMATNVLESTIVATLSRQFMCELKESLDCRITDTIIEF